MKKIKLTKGYETIVDDDVYLWANEFKWNAATGSPTKSYASRREKKRNVYLHREILNAKKGEMVDHINGDSLDNRLENLRICNKSSNGCNRTKQKNNTSGYKGVIYFKWGNRSKRWKAQIFINKKSIPIGYFKTEIEAAKAYNNAALKYHGIFAYLNVITE